MACLGVLAFLTFLWKADEHSVLWKSIILDDWLTRSITINTLVLRWATTVQAAICTSMLAGVLLEQCPVALPAAASIGLLRYQNTGPLSLLRKLRRSWNRRSKWIIAPTALLLLTTTLLQFSSTALLFQVGEGAIPVYHSALINYSFVDLSPAALQQVNIQDVFTSQPPKGFPAFAEWLSNSTKSNADGSERSFAPSRVPGLIDTGTAMRAFLPIGDADIRSRLLEYRGMATVVDTRVVCMRPKLSNLVLSINKNLFGGGATISGPVDTDQEPSGLLEVPSSTGGTDTSKPFNCSITISVGYQPGQWVVSFCQIVFPGIEAAKGFDPATFDEET